MSSDPNDPGLFVDVKPVPSKSPGVSAPKIKDVRKRWIFVAVGAIAFVIVVSTMMHSNPPAPQPKKDDGSLINLTPKNVNEKGWQVQSLEQIHKLEADNQAAKVKQAQMEEELAALRKAKSDPPKATVAPPLPQGVVAPPTLENNSTSVGAGSVPPPPLPITSTLPQPTLPPVNGTRGTARLPAGNLGNGGFGSLSVPPPYSSDSALASPEPMVFTPDKSVSRPSADTGPAIDARVKYKKNTQSGMMVAGAFAPVVLLNGIDAGTSSGSRANPMPVLIRVQDQATLPGSAKYSLKSCFMLGSGYGDLSSERVYIRLARLSCIDSNDRLVLSVPVQGYVVDSDNTLGMRGKLVDRQGARLGKALLAGFAQGLSGALGGAQGEVTTSALGAATTLTGSAALRSSGLSGVSSASSQLAQFYLKEAQAIFPVIEVQGGRSANIVITEDVTLAWGNVDEQFVREVEPVNKNTGTNP